MMKLNFSILTVVAAMALTGCNTTTSSILSSVTQSVVNQQNTTQTTTETTTGTSSVLEAVLGSILGQNNQVTKEALAANWTYNGASCKFESENLLKQAGGEFIANSVENKIDETFAKYGLKKGISSIEFLEDGTYNLTFGERVISGTYTFDEATGKIVMLGTLGLVQSEGYVVKEDSNTISILYSADKLLDLINLVSNNTSNTSIKSLASLLGSYDGIKVGISLTK